MEEIGLFGKFIIGGLILSFVMTLYAYLRIKFPDLSVCTFERAYQAFSDGGRLTGHYSQDGKVPGGLSNRLCAIHYHAFHEDGDLHEYLEMRVAETVGSVVLRFVNGEISEWLEHELPIEFTMTTALHWRLENLMDKVRVAAAQCEERHRLLEESLRERTWI